MSEKSMAWVNGNQTLDDTAYCIKEALDRQCRQNGEFLSFWVQIYFASMRKDNLCRLKGTLTGAGMSLGEAELYEPEFKLIGGVVSRMGIGLMVPGEIG